MNWNEWSNVYVDYEVKRQCHIEILIKDCLSYLNLLDIPQNIILEFIEHSNINGHHDFAQNKP